MKQQKLHAYRVLLRMARVRELRASAVLSEAAGKERTCQSRLDGVLASRDAISAAHGQCVQSLSTVDMGRYEMLSLLDGAYAAQQQSVSNELTHASLARKDRASEDLLAKRYRERMDAHVDQLDGELHREHAAKAQEESVELWLESRKGP